ncbi:MAG TPA: monooxygenase, partial [Chloroflexi bacterium]|nr:monooxygenase [Chloroflexota bacterium]
LWESREAAEAVYTDEWKAKAATLYGTPPDIRYFDVPVFIDNLSPTKEAR